MSVTRRFIKQKYQSSEMGWQQVTVDSLMKRYNLDSDRDSRRQFIAPFWWHEGDNILALPLGEKQNWLYLDISAGLMHIEHSKQRYANHRFTKVFDKKLPVIDLTGGFLEDSLILLALGYQVVTFERFLPLQLLILNAIERCQAQMIKLPWIFYPADFFAGLKPDNWQEWSQFYFDPMFHEHSDKSAAHGAMTWLREHLPVNPDEAPSSLENLLTQNSLPVKVLVKSWSKSAGLLPFQKNRIRFKGKSTCFDLYSS